MAAERLPQSDPFASAAATPLAAGMRVHAWITLTNTSRLGRAHPQFSVRSAAGDRYLYALRPSHPQVRGHAARLATESVHELEPAGVSLEACGQPGFAHNYNDPESWPRADELLLSQVSHPSGPPLTAIGAARNLELRT